MNITLLEQVYNDEEVNSLYNNYTFTPMMSEWHNMNQQIKKQYGKNTLLFFQLGTFYETYFHDAVIISKVLGFTLTSKNKSKPDSACMAGMPIHADISKLEKLLDMGFNIVFAEEMPCADTGNIKRTITKIITPSTNLEFLGKDSNYLLSISQVNKKIGLALLDITTNDFKFAQFNEDDLSKLEILCKFNIKEVITDGNISQQIIEEIKKFGILNIHTVSYSLIDHEGYIESSMGQSIDNLEIYTKEAATISVFNCLKYISGILSTDSLEYISYIEDISENDKLEIGKNTIRNLELVQTINGGRVNTLYGVINNTLTPFGSRKLRQNILFPFTNKKSIENRLNTIQELGSNKTLQSYLRTFCSKFYDIEKLSIKLGSNNINPIDLLNISKSLSLIEDIKEQKSIYNEVSFIKNLINSMYDYTKFISKVNDSIKEAPCTNIKEGGFIKNGYNKELDNQRSIFYNIKDILKDIEKEYREKTGITNLKIIENTQGFFIEVNNKFTNKVLEEWIFARSLTNSTRYTNSKLNDLLEKFRLAEVRIKEIEYELFQEVRVYLSRYIHKILEDADKISEIDIITTFHYNAELYNYTRPIITDNKIDIKEGRHPVIENLQSNFIPNDYINNKRLQLITGPNMGGKSTYLKQIALISILGQIGSFIPAKEGSSIQLLQAIYTRIGANDNLEEGLSTFGLEMKEMGYICNKYKEDSLVLLDEVGRGTDTLNGLALSKAFLDFFLSNDKGNILFSTHYSELISYTKQFSNSKNLKVLVDFDENNKIIFLHKIVEGDEENSYGIEIAELQGVPKSIIDMAEHFRKQA